MSIVPLKHAITTPLFPFDDWGNNNHEVGPLGLVEHREMADAHVFRVHMPGLKREDVTVLVEDGGRVLRITGEKKVARKEKYGNNNNNWFRVERSSGEFFCAFTLPENARVDQLKSKMENGVLTVTFRKRDKRHTHLLKTIFK